MPKLRSPITEQVSLPSVSDGRVLLGAAVREAGLDPEVFLAVVPADVGVGGRVNSNNRLYPPEDKVREHERICREASDRSIPGYQGHPDSQESWDLVMRLLGGKHRIDADGAVVCEATFGILNNSLGRDLMVAWRAGFSPETSLRGFGVLEDHDLTEDSEFAGMNPDRLGQSVGIVREFELEGYDAVRVASAGTRFPDIDDVEIRESLRRIAEASGQKPRTKERTMLVVNDLKSLAELREQAPDVHADLIAQATEAAKTEVAEEVAATITAKDASILDLEKQLSEANQKVRDLEVQREGVTEANDKLEGRIAALESDLKRRDTRAKVTEAVSEFAKGRPGGAIILRQVMEDFDAGRISTIETAKEEAERKASLVEAATKSATVAVKDEAPVSDPVEADDGGVQTESLNENATAAADLAELMA